MGPVLMIMCGLPYSGSTELSRGLVEAIPGATLIDVADILSERGFGHDGEPVPMIEWSTTYQVAYERLAEALEAGQPVVFEAGNYSKAQRDVMRMHARRAGGEAAVVYIAFSEEESRQRREAAESPMDEHEFERALDRFEVPGPAERVVMYLPGMDVEDLASGLSQVFGQ